MESNNSVGKEEITPLQKFYSNLRSLMRYIYIPMTQSENDRIIKLCEGAEELAKQYAEEIAQPLSPQSSVGVEEKEEMIEKIKDKLFSIENWGENIIADEIYSLFASYSSLMNKEKDEFIEKLKQDIYDLYDEQHKLEQLLSEKEKECEQLKQKLTQ